MCTRILSYEFKMLQNNTNMNMKFYNMKQIIYLFAYVFQDRMVLLLKIKGYDLLHVNPIYTI